MTACCCLATGSEAAEAEVLPDVEELWLTRLSRTLRSCRVRGRLARSLSRFHFLGERALGLGERTQVLLQAGQLLRRLVLGRCAECLLLLTVERPAGAGLLGVALAEHFAEVLPRADQACERGLLVAKGPIKLRVSERAPCLVHGRDGLLEHRDRLTTLGEPLGELLGGA